MLGREFLIVVCAFGVLLALAGCDREMQTSPASGVEAVQAEIAEPEHSAHPHFTLADEGQFREPFKVFDNLYFVGIEYVASWLLATDDGLILIDSLFSDEEYLDYLLGNIRKVGFDPAELKYIVLTQGHPDHYGQAFSLQELTGAVIGTGLGDWELIENDLWSTIAPRRDWVIEDLETLTVGDTTITFMITPGHTSGTVSLEFPVIDGNKSYQAFLAGGTSVRTHDPDVLNKFIEDMERIKSIEGIEVQINNHPFIDDLFARQMLLVNRKEGETHPFVSREDFLAFVDQRIGVAKDQLEGKMDN
ncbi:MAG: MBL fold metallo-hydrolase [Alphaproteobacteria bacterium]|nr:MBL fold metallo-hydrolase [Alphaproteobacteria bacterium]